MESGTSSLAWLVRPRLRRLVLDEPRPRVCTVIAPAGFGKSVLLADLVARHDNAALIRIDGSQLQAGSLRARAIATAAGLDDLRPRLLAVDDIHMLVGTAAEDDLAALLADAAPSTQFVLAGRFAPPLELHRDRLESTLVEMTANDLRFRSWEVEELFHDVFGVRMPPQELSTLAAVTEGWAAGLQLYRHAVSRSSENARRVELARLRQCRQEAVRSYLAANVLAALDDDLREFAIGSSVFGVMVPQLCNRLLGRTDSARCLDRLVDRQLFTARDDEGAYRFHEVFRSFLEAELANLIDPDALAQRYHAAGSLLEGHGSTTDAIRAYVVAGSSADAARLLAGLGASSPDEDAWMDTIPDGLLADHWLRLSRARSLLRSGRPAVALREFTGIAETAGSEEARSIAQREVDRLRRWLQAGSRPPDRNDWTSFVHAALEGRQLSTLERGELEALPEPGRSLALAFGFLVQSDLGAAIEQLLAIDRGAVAPEAAWLVSFLRAIAWWLLDGVDGADEIARLRDDADAAHRRWPTRLLRALLVAFPYPEDPPASAALTVIDDESRRDGDPWSPALARLMLLLGCAQGTLRPIDADARAVAARSAVPALDALGARALSAWSVAARALIARHDGDESLAPTEAELRSAGEVCPGLVPVLRAASRPADRSGREGDRTLLLTRRLRRDSFGGGDGGDGDGDQQLSQRLLTVRCLGAFRVSVNEPVDLSGLRPQALSLLRRLSAQAGTPVHRDVLLEAMWPGADPVAAAKRLHVAVSSIRHALGSAGGALVRRGETYVLGSDTWQVETDVAALDAAAQRFATAARNGDAAAEEEAAGEVVALHAGPFLADEGLSDWVLEERRRHERVVGDACARLAQIATSRRRDDDAIAYLERGLQADRFRDELWRALLDLLARTERPAELERAKRSYDEVLATLGVTR